MTLSANALHQAFNFTPDDLRANAFGDITQRQVANLMRIADDRVQAQRRWLFRAGWVTFGAVTAIVLAGNKVDAFGLIAIVAVYLPLVTWMIRRYQRLGVQITDDIARRQTRMVCGKLTKVRQPIPDGEKFVAYVYNQSFEVNGEQFNALQANESYCIFYAIHTRLIFSVWVYRNRFA